MDNVDLETKRLLIYVTIAVSFAAGMTAAGIAFPGYSDLALLVLFNPPIAGFVVLTTFLLSFGNRRVALLGAVILASPAMMLTYEAIEVAAILLMVILLLGVTGIVAAVALQFAWEWTGD